MARTVGLVALPQAMALAIASGLNPQAGIFCDIVTGFLISALGGSKTQIGGPTGAFVVVAFPLFSMHYRICDLEYCVPTSFARVQERPTLLRK